MNEEKVLEIISQELSVSVEDILGKCRKHKFEVARHLAFMFLHDTCNMSNCAIARMFHFAPSTILQTRKSYRDLLNIGDKEYTYYYDKVKNAIDKE